MENYFYQDDAKKVLREELLTDKARVWAESFINPKFPKERWQRNIRLTSAQLRKFHGEAKTLEERVKNLKDQEEFQQIRPLIKMMKAKVAYACPINGIDRKVPEEFRKYIEEMVDNIEDARDFQAFALCFEAVVGFFYGQGGR
ncbi:MAG: type III-A CRISPR-associated protein Csm2 [Nitrospirae bacterium]|nr:type III-A CRISPR-associated protein Csm2 [Nitrospirota bacterium]